MLHNHDVIMVADAVRVGLIVGAAVTIALILDLLIQRRSMSRFQTARFLSVVAASFSVLFTEVGRIGTEVTWRLPVNVAFVVLALYGLANMMHRPS